MLDWAWASTRIWWGMGKCQLQRRPTFLKCCCIVNNLKLCPFSGNRVSNVHHFLPQTASRQCRVIFPVRLWNMCVLSFKQGQDFGHFFRQHPAFLKRWRAWIDMRCAVWGSCFEIRCVHTSGSMFVASGVLLISLTTGKYIVWTSVAITFPGARGHRWIYHTRSSRKTSHRVGSIYEPFVSRCSLQL